MSDLATAQRLIAGGERDKAIGLLASILLKNREECEAWLLLGDLIDEPSRKKVCYQQVLRLSPQNSHALTKLGELQLQPLSQPAESPDDPAPGSESSLVETRPKIQSVPSRISYPDRRASGGGREIIGYVLGGIAGFLVLLYIIASPGDPSRDSNSLYVGLVFLSLIAVVIAISASSKKRG